MAKMSKTRGALRMVHGHDDAMMHKEFEMLSRRDDDLSVKSGSILGFCGLLLASVLVLLAAEPQTALHVEEGDLAVYLAITAVVFLFIGAAFALAAITRGHDYDMAHAEAVIASVDKAVRGKEARWRTAALFTYLGGVLAAGAYVLVVVGHVAGIHVPLAP